MNEKKWFKLVQRRSDFWKNFMMISSLHKIRETFGVDIEEQLTTRRGMDFTHWHSTTAVEKFGIDLKRKIIDNPKFSNHFLKKFKISTLELERFNKKLRRVKIEKLTNAELLEKYLRFCELYSNIYPTFHVTACVNYLEKKLADFIKEKIADDDDESQFAEIFSKLTSFWQLNLLQREELDLIKIAAKAKEGKLADKSLKSHVEKYAGLPVINDETKPWAKEYFFQKFNELTRLSFEELVSKKEDLENLPKEIKKEINKIHRDLSTPKQIKNLFNFLAICGWVRLVGRNSFSLAHYYSKPLFTELGRRFKLSLDDIKWLKPGEVKDLFVAGKYVSDTELKDREACSVLYYHKGNFEIFQGKEAEKIIARELGDSEISIKNHELRGNVAYQGSYAGKVKVVNRQNDIANFVEGDILVTRMTTTDLLPAVRKAGAIITDEGGITCHAAILAREMKIPCVIGTKSATTILKDGMLVEVDAVKGRIRFK